MTHPVLISEEEIIAQIYGGEKTLFHDLIRPYTRIMFGYADAVLRNPATSEDAVQKAPIKVFLNLPKLEDRSRFRAWLLQIVINEARMYRRRLRKSLYESLENADGDSENDAVPRQFPDWHELPDEALNGVELRKARGWDMMPFEGNRYIRARCLKTGFFRLNFVPGICPYKGL